GAAVFLLPLRERARQVLLERSFGRAEEHRPVLPQRPDPLLGSAEPGVDQREAVENAFDSSVLDENLRIALGGGLLCGDPRQEKECGHGSHPTSKARAKTRGGAGSDLCTDGFGGGRKWTTLR